MPKLGSQSSFTLNSKTQHQPDPEQGRGVEHQRDDRDDLIHPMAGAPGGQRASVTPPATAITKDDTVSRSVAGSRSRISGRR